MALNRLDCLLQNIKEGKIDPKVGKELLLRVKSLEGHFPGDPNRVVGTAIRQFEGDLESRALKLRGFGRAVKEVGKNFEGISSLKEVKQNVVEAIGGRVEFKRRGALNIFAAPLEGIGKLSKVENISLLRAAFGEEVPKKGPVAKALSAIRDGEKLVRRSLQEFGEAGAKPPKNSVRVDLPSIKAAEKSSKEFIGDIGKLDTEFLVENIPYMHKVKGGINGYLEKIHAIMKEGPSMYRDLDWGVSASQALSDFKRSLYAGSRDSYMSFKGKYGTPEVNLVGDYVNTVRHVSDQIARMEAFGGDIKQYSKFLEGKLDEKGLLDQERKNLIKGWASYANGEFDQWTHRTKEYKIPGPSGFSIVPYKWFSAMKTLAMVKVNTGGVFGAIFGDLITTNRAMANIGLKSKFTSDSIWTSIKGDRKLAERMGLATEYMIDRITDQTRFVQEDLGTKTANKIATWSSRASGLEFLTRLRRETAMFDISHQMASLKVPFEELDDRMIRTLRFADIGETEWNALKAIKWEDGRGGVMMDPSELAKTDIKLARKLSAFFERLKENSIPTNGIRKQKVLKETLKGKGIATHAVMENMFIFQGWNSSLFENHLAKAWEDKPGSRAIDFIKLAALLGTAKLAQDTLTNTSKGETTNFQDPLLYYDAFTSSGAFSLVGDFAEIASSYRKTDQFLGQKAGGVVFGSGIKLGQAIWKAGNRALEGKETQLGFDLLKIADGYNPAQKIWWSRLAYDSTLGKYTRELASPKASRKQERRRIKRLRKEGRKEIAFK